MGMEEQKGKSLTGSRVGWKFVPHPNAHSFLMKQACNLITWEEMSVISNGVLPNTVP